MSLHDALKERGYTFRQHLEEEGWGMRKLTVVDLSEAQQQALTQGGLDALRAQLDRDGLWTFPAFDIEQPLPRSQDLVLAENDAACTSIVAPGDDEGLRALGQSLAKTIKQRHGIQLHLLDDTEAKPELLETEHLILIGGAHENRLAMELALRHRTLFVDATVPGEDGWIVTTHTGLHASGHNVAQLSASTAHRDTAMACLLDAIAAEEGRTLLRHTHRIEQGRLMREHLPTWESYAGRLPNRIAQLKGRQYESTTEPVALATLIGEGLHSGGFEKNMANSAPIQMAIESARYYQLSGDERALRLCRELLFQIADYYLKTPEGASYPSDLDFPLGQLIRYYAQFEHHPIFSDEDRLILANLLLSCSRSIYEYSEKQWPVEPEQTTRHNHETFPALSLLYAADYFSRYDLPYVKDWLGYVERVFHRSSRFWHRGKQKENARGYEPAVFVHACAYSAFHGHGLSLFGEGCLKQLVQRMQITADNFLRATDYGDSRPEMKPTSPAIARLLATADDDPATQWFAAADITRRPLSAYLDGDPLIKEYPGLRQRLPDSPPATGEWELAPLDEVFRSEYAPEFPTAYAFDKLAFRTGWNDEDHYLLLEGIGNKTVSHSHNELNGIVRINHLGRHWIVSNGYGRPAGDSNAATSFRSRIRGPEDHNMLVLQRDGEIVHDLPMCCAMLQRGRDGQMLYTTTALLGYSGVNWFRTLLIYANAYVLVIDRMQINEPGLDSAHVEWNAIGDINAQPQGFRLAQQGVFMDVLSDSGWDVRQDISDRSASWQRTLTSDAYPYANFPLKKLIYTVPSFEAGQSHALATLLAATTEAKPAYTIAQPEPGHIRIEGAHEAKNVQMNDGDLAVGITHGACEVRFAHMPAVPEALRGETV